MLLIIPHNIMLSQYTKKKKCVQQYRYYPALGSILLEDTERGGNK